MILDSSTILFDDDISKHAQAPVVSLAGITIPGKLNPIPLSLYVKSTLSGATTAVKIKLQQSDNGTSGWEDVPGGEWNILAKDYAKIGRVITAKYLPRAVEKPFIKIVMSADGGGSLTSGKIFMALTRGDDEPYQDGLYIDKGKVLK